MLSGNISKMDKKTINKILHMKASYLKRLKKSNQNKYSMYEKFYLTSTNRDYVNFNINCEKGSKCALFREILFEIKANLSAIDARIRAVKLAINKWQIVRDEHIGSVVYEELLTNILLDAFDESTVDRINYRYGNRNRLWNGSYIPKIMMLKDVVIKDKLIKAGSRFKVVDNKYITVSGTSIEVKGLLDASKVTIIPE